MCVQSDMFIDLFMPFIVHAIYETTMYQAWLGVKDAMVNEVELTLSLKTYSQVRVESHKQTSMSCNLHKGQ